MTTATDYRKKAEEYRARGIRTRQSEKEATRPFQIQAIRHLSEEYELMAIEMDVAADQLEGKEIAHESG